MINADDVDPMPDEPEPDHDFWTQRDILAPYPPVRPIPRRRPLPGARLRFSGTPSLR